MILLHSINRPITSDMLWWSRRPCLDNYHSGYEHERNDPIAHHECCRNNHWQPPTRTGNSELYACECQNCVRRVTHTDGPSRGHYWYHQFVDIDGNHHDVDHADSGEIVCPFCFEGNCPEEP